MNSAGAEQWKNQIAITLSSAFHLAALANRGSDRDHSPQVGFAPLNFRIGSDPPATGYREQNPRPRVGDDSSKDGSSG